MRHWFLDRWIARCECCGGEFGETTGVVRRDGRDLLACSLCVEADRVGQLRSDVVADHLRGSR